MAKKKESIMQTWTNITGVARVWGTKRKANGKTFYSYSMSTSNKKPDGDYDTVYFDAVFVKDADDPKIEEAFYIDIQQGFISVSAWDDVKTRKVKPRIVVMKYELIEE